jgi:hydrogenase nickel incorporation protein HypA/HybF
MHELSVALSLVEAVQEEAEKHPGEVSAIHLRLGPLSGVVKEALVSAFGLATEGTPLAHSSLVVEDVPVVVYCAVCKQKRPVDSVQWFCCAVCQTPATEVVQGRELEIVALEME